MSVMWYLMVLTCISLMTTTLVAVFPRCYSHCSINSPRVLLLLGWEKEKSNIFMLFNSFKGIVTSVVSFDSYQNTVK